MQLITDRVCGQLLKTTKRDAKSYFSIPSSISNGSNVIAVYCQFSFEESGNKFPSVFILENKGHALSFFLYFVHRLMSFRT